jgi:hypothetical protein
LAGAAVAIGVEFQGRIAAPISRRGVIDRKSALDKEFFHVAVKARITSANGF